jgi:hypothetical protein
MRRLPGPADCRLSEGVHGSRGSLRIVLGLAENTNSIFCDGSHEPETANGCPVLRRAGATRREAYTRRMNPEAASCAVSRPRPIHLRLPLTTDLHGSRQYGSLDPAPRSFLIAGKPGINAGFAVDGRQSMFIQGAGAGSTSPTVGTECESRRAMPRFCSSAAIYDELR